MLGVELEGKPSGVSSLIAKRVKLNLEVLVEFFAYGTVQQLRW